MNNPRVISEAKKDGTNYVVYDPEYNLKDGVSDGWVIAYYEEGKWKSLDNAEIVLNPTYFVEYYGWDVV